MSISLRLQEGREFLDSEPEILFAQYGLAPQEWTVLGIVGMQGGAVTDLPNGSPFVNENLIIRTGLATYINAFLGQLGRTGFTDIPQAPGFSIVPIGVYRSIAAQA